MAEDQGVTERWSLRVLTSRTLCWEAAATEHKNMSQNSDPNSFPKEKEKQDKHFEKQNELALLPLGGDKIVLYIISDRFLPVLAEYLFSGIPGGRALK
jgi:hypothetical protein